MNSIKSIYCHNPSPAQLEYIIRWMLHRGYRFLSADELYHCLTDKCIIKGRLAFLSLDDAWRSNLELVSIIERYNVHITIFALIEPIKSGNYWWEYVPREEREAIKRLDYSDFCRHIENARQTKILERSCMTAEEIGRLARHPLVSIQSHTLTHPILPKLPDELLYKEIRESKQLLEAIIGHEVNYFSYPNGSYTAREIGVVQKVYKMAFTTDLHCISLSDNILALPRIEITGKRYRDLLKIYNIWPIIRKVGRTILLKPQD